jgi:predicted dehydrogenase
MRIVIAGLGSIGRKHINAIRKIDNSAVIYALRSSKDAPDEPGIINIFDTDDLFNIDFAIISTPTANHIETIYKLWILRCPLFIEKPLYSNLDINETLILLQKENILNYVACNLRFLDCITFVKAELDNKKNKINEVNVYCGSYLPEWRPNQNFREGYSSKKDLGGGVHLDLIHEFDYIYWFFGKPYKTTKTLTNCSTLKIDASDYANYCLQYEAFNVSVILNYFRRDPKRSLEIVFEDKTWQVDLLKNSVQCNNNTIFESDQKIIDTYESQMRYFMTIVNNHEQHSINTVSDAYNVLQICLE